MGILKMREKRSMINYKYNDIFVNEITETINKYLDKRVSYIKINKMHADIHLGNSIIGNIKLNKDKKILSISLMPINGKDITRELDCFIGEYIVFEKENDLMMFKTRKIRENLQNDLTDLLTDAIGKDILGLPAYIVSPVKYKRGSRIRDIRYEGQRIGRVYLNKNNIIRTIRFYKLPDREYNKTKFRRIRKFIGYYYSDDVLF